MSNNYYETNEFEQIENQPTQKPKKNVEGQFIFFTVWKSISSLSDSDLAKIMRLWMEYAETGETEDVDDPYLAVTLNFLKMQTDCGKKRYYNVIEQRSLAGKKGAEARWHKEA